MQQGFSVLDLSPETHYKLRMTAHNSAGSTVSIYGFTTLTSGGATVAPELIIHSEYNYGFLKLLVNPSVVLPVLLALIVIVSMMVFVVHQLKKDRFLIHGELVVFRTFYFDCNTLQCYNVTVCSHTLPNLTFLHWFSTMFSKGIPKSLSRPL